MVRFDLVPLLQGQTRVAKLITRLLLKNAVCLQNHVGCPFPLDTSCIWPQMRPWSSGLVYVFLLNCAISIGGYTPIYKIYIFVIFSLLINAVILLMNFLV